MFCFAKQKLLITSSNSVYWVTVFMQKPPPKFASQTSHTRKGYAKYACDTFLSAVAPLQAPRAFCIMCAYQLSHALFAASLSLRLAYIA